MTDKPSSIIKRLPKIILIVIGAMIIIAAVSIVILWLILTVGFNSLAKSCQERADSIVKENAATIDSFKAIHFAGNSIQASVGSPSVTRGDCVDSQPSMNLVETYAINQPIDEAIAVFANTAKTAGYQAEYDNEPPVCGTDDSDASINAYENSANRSAIDKQTNSKGYSDSAYIQIIPQFTCDASGTTATQLKVTLAISD